MFLTYTRTNPVPLTEFGNLKAGNPPASGQAVTRSPAARFLRQVQRRYQEFPQQPVPIGSVLAAGNQPFIGQAVTRPPAARFLRQVQRRYQQFPQQPVPMGPGLTAGYPPFPGQAVTRPPRAVWALFRQVERRYRQTPTEWAMLGQTVPTLPAEMLVPTAVRPRVTGDVAWQFRRRNLPPDYIATIGPGQTARPPFVGTAAGPRFTPRDFFVRARHFQQPDPRAAMSGLTARIAGSFVGAKLGYLNVQGTRSVTNFQITPHRTGTLTVQ